MFGNRSGLVIGLAPMSMCCVSCEKNTPYHPNLCSHNYKGSSKGMEARVAVKLVVKASNDGTVFTLVTSLVTTMHPHGRSSSIPLKK
jgi:hypothetical protein